jgi:molybdenum cofactor cytidylyltransferase
MAWRKSAVSHVIVVVRANDAALAELIPHDSRVAVVRADPPPEHMKDSVVLGLDLIQRDYRPKASDVWLLAPADMPRLSSSVINGLLAAHIPLRPQILIPQVGGKKGHPVLFPWPLAAAARNLHADEGLNVLRERFAHRTIDFTDASVFDDLDTPDDYRQLND